MMDGYSREEFERDQLGQTGTYLSEIAQLRAEIATLTKERDDATQNASNTWNLYQRARLQMAQNRYVNPWTVEVKNVLTDESWHETIHDAPLTLTYAEARMKQHQADSPDATFRVVPWLNPQQRQHANKLAERALAESVKLTDRLGEALETFARTVPEFNSMTEAPSILVVRRILAEWHARAR